MKKTVLPFSLDTIRAVQGFQVLRQGANILLAILLAKSGLDLEEIGLYELLIYIGATISFFWVSGTLQAYLTFHPAQSPDERKGLLFSAYLFFLLMALLTALFLWGGQAWIQRVLAGGAELRYLGLFTAYLAINLPTFLLEHFLQLDERPIEILGFGLISFGGQLVVVAVPVYLGWGLYGSFVGLIGLAAIKHVLLLVFLLRNSRVHFDLALLSGWLGLSLPLVGYTLIGGFSQAFDGWLVNWTFQGDEGMFATWRYGARELPFSLALVAGLSSGLLPGISTRLEATLEDTRRRSLRLQHFLFPLAIGLMLTSRWWFPWVFSEAFQDSIPVFNLFLLIIISRLIMSRTIMTGLKENGFVLGVSIVELGLNVGLSFLFVSQFGLLGIALGTVLAYTFEKVAHGLRLYGKYGIRPGQYIHVGWLTFYSVLLVGAFWVAGWLGTGS